MCKRAKRSPSRNLMCSLWAPCESLPRTLNLISTTALIAIRLTSLFIAFRDTFNLIYLPQPWVQVLPNSMLRLFTDPYITLHH